MLRIRLAGTGPLLGVIIKYKVYIQTYLTFQETVFSVPLGSCELVQLEVQVPLEWETFWL